MIDLNNYPPCPFCGGTQLIAGHWYLDDEGEVDAVECDNCKAGAPATVWLQRTATENTGAEE